MQYDAMAFADPFPEQKTKKSPLPEMLHKHNIVIEKTRKSWVFCCWRNVPFGTIRLTSPQGEETRFGCGEHVTL
jgi:hypothetical protein